MTKATELAQLGGLVDVTGSGTATKVGIGTTVDISGGLSIKGTPVISNTGVWQGSSAGIQGAQGTGGVQGIQGITGTQGIQGISGAQGATGSQGTQGATGSQGTSGAQGATGTQGTQGTAGPSTTINATDDSSTATLYPVMVGATGSNQTAKAASTRNFRYDAANGYLGIGGTPDSIFYVGSGADAIVNGYANSRLVVNDNGNRQADIFARNHVDDVMVRLTAGTTSSTVGSISNHQLEFCINNSTQLVIDTSGNLIPSGDGVRNLGSSGNRWANIYSADLQLSNEGSQNDVDGTWGKYTIQEGENDLFLINRRTGKKYKFLLEEVK